MRSRSKKTERDNEKKSLEKRNRLLLNYIKEKVNQLLRVMGTKPLREDELSDDDLINFDPIGIIAESFEQVLENLRESNRKLQTARDHLQAIFDTAGVGISIVDRDLRIITCNEKQKELLVRDVTDIDGRHCYEVYCGIDSPPLICPAIETLETGRSVLLKEVTKKGRTFQIATSPLKNNQGEITGVIEVSMDITEKKLAEEARRQSEKLIAVGQLAAGIAHELNNPLGNIIGYAKLILKENNLPPSVKERVNVIIEQAKRGNEIIKGLLEFSHQKFPQLRMSSIDSCIESALHSLEDMIEKNKIKIIKNTDNLPHLMLDPQQISQVVHNIVLNAIQATGKNGIIKITGYVKDRFLEVAIEDNGPGIPEEFRHRIFEPFFTTKPVGKGTGLGLSICLEIMKKHGGDIKLQSKKESGATFILSFPLRN